MRFRLVEKKPVRVVAITWDGSPDTAAALAQAGCTYKLIGNKLEISTLEGNMTADLHDEIIRGVAGEWYPCKPGIFARTYTETGTEVPDVAAATTGDTGA